MPDFFFYVTLQKQVEDVQCWEFATDHVDEVFRLVNIIEAPMQRMQFDSSFCVGDDKTKGEKRVIANWGDTLWSLADEHHVSIDDIRRSNNLPPVLLFVAT